MGRLIDDDLLKVSISQGEIVIDEDVLKCDTMHDMLLYLLKKVDDFMIATIDAQPTAYDVEAVVERLKRSPELIVGESKFKGIYIKKHYAIGLVKEGGVNGES